MSWPVAITVCAVLIIAAITGLYLVTVRPEGAHSRYVLRRQRPRPLADPADVTDPDGTQFVAGLHHEDIWTRTITLPAFRPHCLPGCDRLDGHDGRDIGACMRGGAVLYALRPSGAAPRPDDTAPLPHAVGTWGMPRDELLDKLARQYLEVTR